MEKAEYQRSYRQANFERLAKYYREYRKRNRDRISARMREFYKANAVTIKVKERSRYNDKRVFATADELVSCRQNSRTAKTMRGPEHIVCLECGQILKTLSRHLRLAHNLTGEEYRDRWGCNRSTALAAVALCQELSQARKRIRLKPPARSRFGQRAAPPRRSRPSRLEGRLNHRKPTSPRQPR